MITEVFIENKRLDINQELDYLITYAVDDIKDFEHKQSNFSKTIILPGTANNNYLFGHIFNVQGSNIYDSGLDNVGMNFNPAKSAVCLIFQNRLQVFKGTLRILEIVIREGQIEYEVAVFGELGSLVGELGSGKLEDLDFSLYDHVWNGSNITGSWENVTGGGYYYPLIDYGTTSVAKVDYDIRTFRPALFVKEMLDKIITGAGYNYECDLFDTDRFKNLIIPNNFKGLYSYDTDLISATGGSQPVSSDIAQAEFTASTGSGFTITSSTLFTYTPSAGTQANIDFGFTTLFTGTGYVIFQIVQNGSAIYTETKTTNLATFTGTKITGINSGDTLEFVFTFAIGLTSKVIDSASVVITATTAVPVPINPGDTVVINDTLPRNVLQKDFLASIIRLFNLYVYEDRLKPKFLYIKPYVDFYDLNVSGVTDWTYKVDRSRDIRLKPMSELNSRIYNFNFKADNDYYNELYRKTYNQEYGNYKYDSGYEFANDTTNIDLIFSPSVLVGYADVDKIVTAMYKKNAGVEETFATNIRILQAKKVTGVASWKIKNGVSDLITGLTVYGYGGHYDDPDAPANDIHFGVPAELYFTLVTGAVNVTQFNVYWSPYMAEITDKDSKLLTCYMKLTDSDIFNLNFGTIIYVDGSYWRLNKIEDYNANSDDVCKVELLKIINLLY